MVICIIAILDFQNNRTSQQSTSLQHKDTQYGERQRDTEGCAYTDADTATDKEVRERERERDRERERETERGRERERERGDVCVCVCVLCTRPC